MSLMPRNRRIAGTIRCLVFAFLFAATCPRMSMAQTISTNAALRGVVTDSSGAAIPEATIVVTNEGTGSKRTTVTDGSGRYEVLMLPVGTYSLSADAPGFRPEIQMGLQLETGSVAALNIQMQVGVVAEKVSVEANASLIEASHAAIGEVVENKQVLDLPLNGRSFGSLALITPQVNVGNTQAGWYPVMPGPAADVTIAGSRAENNQITLDGTTVTNDYTGGTMIYPSVDDLQEFKIVEGSYSAELGGRQGQILLVTKSGTNYLHGSAYEFLRNDALDARNFFDGSTKFPLRQNQFGASLGGPIVLPHIYNGKDKTHFFLSYEGVRIHLGSTSINSVPTAQMRTGDFSELSGIQIVDPLTHQPFPNNVIPSSRLSPIALNLLADLRYPLPNSPGISNNYIVNPLNTTDLNQGSARIDHSFSDHDKLSGTVTVSRLNTFSPATTQISASAFNTPGMTTSILYTHVFNPTTLNIAKFGYSYFRPLQPNLNPTTPTLQDLGFPDNAYQALAHGASAGPPTFNFVDFGALGGTGGPFGLYTTHKDFSDTFSKVSGAHSLEFGYNYILTNEDTDAAWNFRGTYAFSGQYSNYDFADFLLGYPATTTREIPFGANPPSSKGVGEFLATNLDHHQYAFAQDNWRVNAKLTLNLGLRYEFNQPGVEANNHISNFVPGVLNGVPQILTIFPPGYNGAGYEVATPPGLGSSLLRSHYLNFAPRVGIAYSPTSRWVIRLGSGIFNSEPPFNARQILEVNPPWFSRQTFNGGTSTPTITLANGFENLTSLTSGGFALNPDYTTIPTYQWTVDIQRQLTHNTILDVFYIGSRTVHMDAEENLNQAAPGPGPLASRRQYPNDTSFVDYSSWGLARYNAATIRVKQQLSSGLTFLAHFTWSKNMDMGEWQGFQPQNNNNLFAEYAPSANNVPLRLVGSVVYELPVGPGKPIMSQGPLSKILGGWTVSGILTLQSGLPFTVYPSYDSSNSELDLQRADRIANGNLPSGQRTRLNWFDTAAFVQPALYTWGSSGRNVLQGPGSKGLDVAVLKNFKLVETKTLQFRAEAFNLPNFVNWGMPGSTLNTPTYGQIWSAGLSRELQFALKFLF